MLYWLIFIYFFLWRGGEWRQASRRSCKWGTETGSGLSGYIMLISLENRSWISEWQFKQQQGKNILRSERPGLWAASVLLHLSLRMLMVGLGIYWAGDWPPDTRPSFYGSLIWVAGHESLRNKSTTTTCYTPSPRVIQKGKKKKKTPNSGTLLIFFPSAHKKTFMVALINIIFNINDLIAVTGEKGSPDEHTSSSHSLCESRPCVCVRYLAAATAHGQTTRADMSGCEMCGEQITATQMRSRATIPNPLINNKREDFDFFHQLQSVVSCKRYSRVRKRPLN